MSTHGTEERGGRGRRTAVTLLLIVGCALAPLAATAIWVRNQVTDSDRYVRTVEPLASNPDIQAAVAADATEALFSRVDVAAEAEAALPPRAQFLAVPLANGVRSFTENTTLRVLDSERFQELWVEVNRITHQQLVKVLTNEGDVVQTADGRVVLDLTPVLELVKRELENRGITIFDRVPANALATSFVLMDSQELERAQRGLRLLKALAIVLPILVFACLGAAIALSRRRRRTLLQASLGLAASMVVLGLALIAARSAYVNAVAGPGLPEDAATAFYDIVVHWLRIGIRAIFAVALLVAAGAFLTGPSRAAVGIRTWFTGLVGRAAGTTGVRSSPAGRWVGDNRRPLRIAAIVVPVVIFFLWSVPTPAVLITLVALSLLALLAIELVGAEPRGGRPVGT
jgi:hypothetical protein